MDAIILAGGVAKGAFAAGALRALFDPAINPAPPRVRRVVAASSGALNGAYLASALRRGAEANAGAELARLWIERASARGTFVPNLAGMLGLEGFSTGDKLLELLRAYIPPSDGDVPVDLRLLVTTTQGEVRPGENATTFEHVVPFKGDTFDTREGLEQLFAAVVASCAFPAAFLPASVRIGGKSVPCFDGGLTNNAPVRHALGARDVARIFVISPSPRIVTPAPADAHGAGLLAHLADIVIGERLYRDVREAHAVNDVLERLVLEFPAPAMRERALRALGWERRTRVEIVEIRPPHALEGNAFDGLFSRSLRTHYVAEGERAARAWLACPEAA